jgi:hypothetical protein
MPKRRRRERWGSKRVLGIGLDPYTIDFDSEFFKGKPLDADSIASGIKADEQRIRGMGHDFEWLLIDARRGAEAASATARAALRARRVDVVVIWLRRPTRSGANAGARGLGECCDRGGARGADWVQYLADRDRGGDWAGLTGLDFSGLGTGRCIRMPALTGLAAKPDRIHTLDEIQVIQVDRRVLDTDQRRRFAKVGEFQDDSRLTELLTWTARMRHLSC